MDNGIRAGQLKTVLLLGGLTALMVGAGSFAAPSYAWAFAIAGVAMNIGMWFFSDRMVLRTSGARLLEPAESPDLHAMVRDLAAAAGIPPPKLYLIESRLRQRLRDRAQSGARRRGGDDGPAPDLVAA